MTTGILATPPVPLPQGGLAHRWGAVMAAHRRLIIGLYLLILTASAAGYVVLSSTLTAPDYRPDHSESGDAQALLARHFPELGTEQNAIVLDSGRKTVHDQDFQAAISSVVRAARDTPGVESVTGPNDLSPLPLISGDRHAALIIVALNGNPTERGNTVHDIKARLSSLELNGIRAGLTGYSPMQRDLMIIENNDLAKAEMIGLPVAFLLLVLALGALAAAALPVVVALAGILLSSGVLYILSYAMPFDSLVLAIASMIGIGIGLDYAMFIVSRFREELAHIASPSRTDIVQATGTAMATAGKNIAASGLIVLISLCSLVVVRAEIFRGIACGVAVAVTSTLVVAATLLPALLATLGSRVNAGALPSRWQPADSDGKQTPGGWARWARIVMARPLAYGLLAVVVLVTLAAPLAGIRHGIDMGLSALAGVPAGDAAHTAKEKFAPGVLAPVNIVVTGPGDSPLTPHAQAAAEKLLGTIKNDRRVSDLILQHRAGRTVAVAIPAQDYDAPGTTQLVRDIRTQATDLSDAELKVGGVTAEFIDISDEITARLPLVIALVLACSFIFLMAVFRSIVLPLKAILMNLLATGAALGLTVAVFQWGLGESIFAFTSAGFIQVYLPTIVFAILFGLSMDYEVFLIGRMKEEWERKPGDNEAAVAAGLQHTARPITAAAAIMVVVFGSFLTATVLEFKQIGFALAVAIALDAVIVRLVLVPALMKLMGRWNWWLPRLRRKPSQPETPAAVQHSATGS